MSAELVSKGLMYEVENEACWLDKGKYESAELKYQQYLVTKVQHPGGHMASGGQVTNTHDRCHVIPTQLPQQQSGALEGNPVAALLQHEETGGVAGAAFPDVAVDATAAGSNSKQAKNKLKKQRQREKQRNKQQQQQAAGGAAAAAAAQQAKGQTRTAASVDVGGASQVSMDEFVTVCARLDKLEAEHAKLLNMFKSLESRFDKMEKSIVTKQSVNGEPPSVPVTAGGGGDEGDASDDGDVDLFASDDDDNDEAERLKAERIKAYQEKKAKKPALIAKSNIILDVKPWDDETDMREVERRVREEVTCDGLVWGASKLVPVGYGIKKLQISCVVEDDKVGTDWLEENITAIEDLVQSVDVAAFNKV